MATASLPPPPSFPAPPEPFAAPDPATSCDPRAKPGVSLFRSFVLDRLGGTDLGIIRECSAGKPSEHQEGRAWDWGLRADRPEDVARAQALFDALLAPDAQGEPAALFRRFGLLYLIWDRHLWSPRHQAWVPYTGVSPHREHVHLSFSRAGARGATSGYAWLRGELPDAPPADQRPGLPQPASDASSAWPRLAAFMVGGGVGWMVTQAWTRRRRASPRRAA